LEVWGAQGGGNGGKGGYAIGRKNITVSGNLYLCIGQQGGLYNGYIAGGAGGYNGGGKGGNSLNNSFLAGDGGGGATHIAITTNRGVLKNYKNYSSEVIIVAGGGGGACQWRNNGFAECAGGGTSTNTVYSHENTYSISGATQTSGYAFGEGQSANAKTGGSCGSEGNGGGGGGWYGGFALNLTNTSANNSNCSGSGGSGHINTSYIYNGTMSNGVQSGNGKALITWMPLL
jgi:hypothetical protein